MNVEAPGTGLAGLLKSLNCDRGYGLALLAACALLLLPALGGSALRDALSFDRGALAAGEWWRFLTAHFVHLDAEHAALNTLGVVLMWALFARDYVPARWLTIYFMSCVSVSLGLWCFNRGLEWYVGASGALHGVMTAGTLAHLKRRDLDGWILAIFIVAKLTYEQTQGSLPFVHGALTVVDAHMYGAIGGLTTALALGALRK